MGKPLCFVVMGFGEKVDLATGRTLDLDKTYRIIIKKAVEEAGLECIRADSIVHAGIIDKPMYELLFSADIVIADLSTSNLNAIYELGVRHALRPHTTIVIAEKQFKFPFDIRSLLIRPYEHLGKGIDAEEADRMKEVLKEAIQNLLYKKQTDSPIYTFLPDLLTKTAPSFSSKTVPEAMKADVERTELLKLFKEVRDKYDWRAAIQYLEKLLIEKGDDIYLKQQMALAVYKANLPDPLSALFKAHNILQELNPKQTTDSETLGLWGAVHKRLWELRSEVGYLDEAIWAYEKGFYLKNDHYNGINFAFLLNVRASVSSRREAIADTVMAERVRRRIITICEALLQEGVENDEGKIDQEQQFWIQATLAEAMLGIGEVKRAEEIKKRAIEGNLETLTIAETKWKPAGWMVDTMSHQLSKLENLMARLPA